MAGFSIPEQGRIVQIDVPKDYSSAASTTEWVSMKYADKCTFIIETGALTSTSAQAITLYVADDASGTHNKAITSASAACILSLPHYWVQAASTDVLTKTTVASSTFNIVNTDDNKAFIIEVNKGDMGTFVSTSTTYNADYVRINVPAPGAHACLRSVIAILTGYRYQEDSPPTAIT